MKNLWMRIPHALLAFLLWGGGFAHPAPGELGGRLMFSVLGPDQGLPSGMVMSLTQDSEGFLWFGTENGLFRYEGGQTRRFTPEDGLPSGYIESLVPAKEGGIWVSTALGLVRFRNGRFESAQFSDGSSKAAYFRVARDGQGRLWAANQQGVFIQASGLQFEKLPFNLPGEPGFLTYGASSGSMYLAWKGGIVAFAPDGGTRTWSASEGLPSGGPLLMAEDGEGRVWAGSGRTLVVKARNGERFTDRSQELDRSLSPNASAYVDPDGTAWLPTQQGALHITGDRIDALDQETGLPFRWVRRLLRDREGTLWVVGSGVARMLGGNRVWNYARAKEETGGLVWCIHRATDGRLLLGTDDGAASLDKGKLTRIPGTEGRRIKAMAEAPDGTLWLTSTIGPALWLRAGKTRAEIAPLGESGTSINMVTKDSRGRIWIGHAQQGLLRWDPSAGRLIQEVGPSYFSAPILGAFDIHEDAHGRLWVGTTLGLLVREADGRCSAFTERSGLLSLSIQGLALVPDGSAWVSYQEPSGMTRVRVEHGQLRVLEHRTQKAGLRSDAIYAMLAGPDGQVWVASDQGLDRLDPPLHLGRHDGMPSEDCALHALLLEGERLWVGTSGGLVRFESGSDQALKAPPKAHLLQMAFGPRRLEPPFGTMGAVPHRESTAVFRFSAPEYQNEQELRFQVRLLGLEDAWRDIDSKVARWPLLPGGSYRFEVRAARGGGPFGEIAGLSFRVRPPWWKSWWAYALEGACVLGAMFGFTRFRVASLARSKAALEIQVARRTEELQARNLELSSALGKVRQLSGLLPICASCKKIRDDRGYWNQLEEYITEHSEVGFSHGICPDCIPKLYPELAAMRAKSASGNTTPSE